MLRRALRRGQNCTTERGIDSWTVDEACEGLIKGDDPAELPVHLTKSVISKLTAMRKDAILHRKDARAAKIEEILGELQYGPGRYQFDTPGNPNLQRSRALNTTKTPRRTQLESTSTKLVSGTTKLNAVDIQTRQAVTPVIKTRRNLEMSREHYPVSRDCDATLDNIYDYEVDSRRLGPRLQKVERIQAQLDEARTKYEEAKAKIHFQRQQFDELEKVAEVELEEKLKLEMVDFGSHVPTELPLEYSKVSNRVLDMQVRERRNAQIRRYDDATALRKEALALERQELDRHNAEFTRAFKLTKQHIQKKQNEKRESFHILWQRKKEKNEAEIRRQIHQLKMAVEHLEKDLAEAKRETQKEMNRVTKREQYS